MLNHKVDDHVVKLEKDRRFYKANCDKQYEDFSLKIEGEMTRRNRFKRDTLKMFEDQANQIAQLENDVQRNTKMNSNAVTSVKKLLDVETIQAALNVQEEKDREWVSLFGKAEASNGASKMNIQDSTRPPQTEKSHFTIN